MLSDPLFYAVAVPCVFMFGLAKGGFAGVGMIAMPVLALLISPVQAAAILLPILIVQDAVGVWAFRRSWDRSVLKLMIPTAAIGVTLGYLLAAKVSVAVVLGVLGAISVSFSLYRLWLSRPGQVPVVTNGHPAVGALLGVAAGFTSQIAHAGQPPFQMWVLPKRLSPEVLVGTTAIFFATVNWIKVPAYLALGQFTPQNMLTSLVLMPIAIGSTLTGVWLVRRIPAERFYTLIYLLMIVVGAELIRKAFMG